MCVCAVKFIAGIQKSRAPYASALLLGVSDGTMREMLSVGGRVGTGTAQLLRAPLSLALISWL